MKKDLKTYLYEIIEYIEDLEKYTENVKFEDFVNNSEKYDACVFKIVLIGEAGIKINNNHKELKSNFPFSKMSGIRNIIIHDYVGIDEKIIWDTIKTSIPILKVETINLLNNL